MIVHCYPADDFGCGFYRMGAPAQILAAQGHEIHLHPTSENRGVGMVTDTTNGRIIAVQPEPGTDVIVLQRVMSARMVTAIRMLREKGVAVVVDMDDDLDRIDPNNPAYLGMHPKHGWKTDANWHNTKLACEAATLVTVSTEALAKRYGSHGRVVVLHNRIPAPALKYPREDSDAIGWAGTVATHPTDLQVVGTSVARLQDQGIEYRGVGPAEGLQEALWLRGEFEVTGRVEIEHYLRAVATMGVGMAPLADTDFNAAKSWLKVLEMSAVGVPWVASPRVEYRRFSAEGEGRLGLFAERPKDWLRQLKRLATDPSLRADQSALGRAVAARHTYEEHAWRWLEAWDAAMMFERRAKPLFRGMVST